jgi:hypothetical protein
MGGADGANPFAARERSPVGVGVACHIRSPSVRGVEGAYREVPYTSALETRRTTYPPAQALRGSTERWATEQKGSGANPERAARRTDPREHL